MVTHQSERVSAHRAIEELAELYGVQWRYRDSKGDVRESPLGAVLSVLRSMGAQIRESDGFPKKTTARDRLDLPDTGEAVEARRREIWECLVDPVAIAWGGALPVFILRLPHKAATALMGADGRSAFEIALLRADGREEWAKVPDAAIALCGEAEVAGRRYSAYRVDLRERGRSSSTRRLPFGYHRLMVRAGSLTGECTIISAPRRCWSLEDTFPPEITDAGWGVFSPLYALRSDQNWGVGDFGDLGWLSETVGGEGGSIVGTLPLLSAYLREPFEPGPYRPVSRLFWNELYLEVEGLEGWDGSPKAKTLWASGDVQARLRSLRSQDLVDYRGVARLKRQVIESLAEDFFPADGEDQDGVALEPARRGLSAFVDGNPEVECYASFMAEVELQGADWRSWKRVGTASSPVLSGADRVDRPKSWRAARRYHLYCQWQAEEQMRRLAASRTSARLLLDLPLGVHPGGFDAWRWRDLFAPDVSIGAPPDSFFARGQNWELPAPQPDRMRGDAYSYFASGLRRQMEHAACVRFDHVMSLHRLYWIPDGYGPAEGVYVGYPAEELYAVLALESHLTQTAVVGEDLGTVPDGVRSAMNRHGVLHSWVLQTAVTPRGRAPVGRVPARCAAALNTHDMFPFAGFIRGDDIQARLETGQVDEGGARRECAARRRLVERLQEWLPQIGQGPGLRPAGAGDPSGQELVWRALAYLAAGEAELVLATVEDLLHETRPQNLPGTGSGQLNWRRRMAAGTPEVEQAVRTLAELFETLGGGAPAKEKGRYVGT